MYTVYQWHCVWVVCMGCVYGLCVYSGILTLARVTTLGRFLCTDSRGLFCRLYTTQATWASFPNSHTQITWSLIPKLSYPDHMEPHSQTLIPKLSYPDPTKPCSQTLIDQCSIFNNFALTTGFYWSNTLLLKSPVVMRFPNSHTQTPEPRFQTLIPKLPYPDPTEPYYSLVQCCVPVANVLASKNLQACCDDTIFFTWASDGCDNMPIHLITKDQSTHEIFALEKGLPVSMMQATKSW